MDIWQIKNYKDFLLLFNQISENCFKRCTHTFLSREITEEEDACIKQCTSKYINANNRSMAIFLEVQPILTQRKIDETKRAQAAMEMQLQAETQSAQTQ